MQIATRGLPRGRARPGARPGSWPAPPVLAAAAPRRARSARRRRRRRGRDPRDAPEAAAVAVGLAGARSVSSRGIPNATERLLLAVDEQRQRLDPLARARSRCRPRTAPCPPPTASSAGSGASRRTSRSARAVERSRARDRGSLTGASSGRRQAPSLDAGRRWRRDEFWRALRVRHPAAARGARRRRARHGALPRRAPRVPLAARRRRADRAAGLGRATRSSRRRSTGRRRGCRRSAYRSCRASPIGSRWRSRRSRSATPSSSTPASTSLHGQVVIDGIVEIQPGSVIGPFVTIGLRAGDVRGATIERDVQHRHRREGHRPGDGSAPGARSAPTRSSSSDVPGGAPSSARPLGRSGDALRHALACRPMRLRRRRRTADATARRAGARRRAATSARDRAAHRGQSRGPGPARRSDGCCTCGTSPGSGC